MSKKTFGSGLSPPFSWSHLGVNTRPLREAFANQIARPVDEPLGPLPPGPPRFGFLVTAGHEGVFLRCVSGMLWHWNQEVGRPVVIAPARSLEVLREGVGTNHADFAVLRETYPEAVEDVRALSLAGLYFWEVGTDPLNYALAFHRFAPRQCTSWGTQGTSGAPGIDAYLGSALVEPENGQEAYTETLLRGASLLTWQERVRTPPARFDRSHFGLPTLHPSRPTLHAPRFTPHATRFTPPFSSRSSTIFTQSSNRGDSLLSVMERSCLLARFLVALLPLPEGSYEQPFSPRGRSSG